MCVSWESWRAAEAARKQREAADREAKAKASEPVPVPVPSNLDFSRVLVPVKK